MHGAWHVPQPIIKMIEFILNNSMLINMRSHIKFIQCFNSIIIFSYYNFFSKDHQFKINNFYLKDKFTHIITKIYLCFLYFRK